MQSPVCCEGYYPSEWAIGYYRGGCRRIGTPSRPQAPNRLVADVEVASDDGMCLAVIAALDGFTLLMWREL